METFLQSLSADPDGEGGESGALPELTSFLMLLQGRLLLLGCLFGFETDGVDLRREKRQGAC